MQKILDLRAGDSDYLASNDHTASITTDPPAIVANDPSRIPSSSTFFCQMLPFRRQDVVETGQKKLSDLLSTFGRPGVKVGDTVPTFELEVHHYPVLSRAGHDYTEKINSDDIFETTQHHINYKWNLSTLKGLDKYNDCTPYGITERKERECLRQEITRLVNSATSTSPFLFDSRNRLDAAVDRGSTEISHIADQIRCAMGIIRLDNARVSLEHCTTELEETAHSFRQARRRLMGRYNTDQGRVEGSAPVQLEPKERNRQLYHALVDFITGSVARLLVRTAVSEYWSQTVFSSLASFAVKLKVLGNDTEKYARFSIATAEGALESMNQSSVSKEQLLIKIRPSPDDDIKDIDTVDTETDTSRHYHMEKTLLHTEVYWLIRRVLHNVLIKESKTASAGSFEIHTTVYKAGLDCLPTSLTSDRLGEISVSSDFFVVKNSCTAIGMVIENIKAIDSRNSLLSKSTAVAARLPGGDNKMTTIACQWLDPEESPSPFKRQIDTANVDEVFSVVIPLSLGTAWVARSLARLISSAGVTTDEQDPIVQFKQQSRNFEANFTVTTAGWKEKEQRISQQKYKDDDVVTVPRSRIRPGVQAGTTNLASTYNISHNSDEDAVRVTETYQRDKDAMNQWIIAEDSIRIECRGYVFFVLTVAAIMVLGGIAIPFVARNRISGVDPFQITLFLWVIAGVIILAAKGKYVSEWPWHEFLHGHVVCRTLRETC
ncbi:hypothetical protein F4808DRAFT_196330 [Astrocystis sublimbata]|nr:hypothetical protein F4808DRAFT_196330 [Astrocystis sublimbata]